MVRCEISDLWPDQCAHCRGLGKVKAVCEFSGIPVGRCAHCEQEPAYKGLFEARYHSHCVECDGRISPGDMIASDGVGGYLCVECSQA